MYTWERRSDASTGMMGDRKFDKLKSLQNILRVNKWWNVRRAGGGGGATGVGGLEELIKKFP